jgi:hypothetical protein
VATARRLLGDSYFNVVVSDAADVYAITRTGRYVSARQRAALIARDPVCVAPGCDIAYGLEIHHWQKPVELGGRTELSNLLRACKVHHAMVHHRQCSFTGGPGRWGWADPRRPDEDQARRSSNLGERDNPTTSTGRHRPAPHTNGSGAGRGSTTPPLGGRSVQTRAPGHLRT